MEPSISKTEEGLQGLNGSTGIGTETGIDGSILSSLPSFSTVLGDLQTKASENLADNSTLGEKATNLRASSPPLIIDPSRSKTGGDPLDPSNHPSIASGAGIDGSIFSSHPSFSTVLGDLQTKASENLADNSTLGERATNLRESAPPLTTDPSLSKPQKGSLKSIPPSGIGQGIGIGKGVGIGEGTGVGQGIGIGKGVGIGKGTGVGGSLGIGGGIGSAIGRGNGVGFNGGATIEEIKQFLEKKNTSETGEGGSGQAVALGKNLTQLAADNSITEMARQTALGMSRTEADRNKSSLAERTSAAAALAHSHQRENPDSMESSMISA